MRIGVITDAHLCPPGTPPDGCHNPYAYDQAASILEAALAGNTADSIDLLAVLGDLSNGGHFESLNEAVALLASADGPMLVVAGNHDRDVEPRQLATLVDHSLPGGSMADPSGTRIAGVFFAGLPISNAVDDGWTVEEARIDDWPNAPVVVLSHVPLISRESAVRDAGLKYAGGLHQGDSLVAALLARTSPTIVIHGHLHVRDESALGSVLQIGCAALIEPPHERAVLDLSIDGDVPSVSMRRVPVIESPPVRLPVLVPCETAWRYSHGAWTSAEPPDL